jgi:hypothetical protein
VILLLKAGIVEQVEAAVARKRRGKHVSAATKNTQQRNCWEQCFLCGPRRNCMTWTNGKS